MCLERDEYVDSFICINIGMKDDLVEMVVHLNYNCVVMGSNLGLNKIIFFLLKLTLAWTSRVTQTLARQLQWLEKYLKPSIEWSLSSLNT